MEAPFSVKGDPALIKIGYECGWGRKTVRVLAVWSEPKNNYPNELLAMEM